MSRLLTRNELAALRGPQHWSAETAQRVLTTWRASRLSRAEFCAKHQLRSTRLSTWERQLGDWQSLAEVSPAEAMAHMVPAVVHTSSHGEAPLSLQLPSGLTIEVRAAERVSPEWLAALVTALGRSA
jgi:hypothetical protein